MREACRCSGELTYIKAKVFKAFRTFEIVSPQYTNNGYNNNEGQQSPLETKITN